MPFHPAVATGSRARLRSCCSGAHRCEHEKLPAGPPTSQPQKPPWAHTSHFWLPSQREEGLGGREGSCVRRVPLPPGSLGGMSLKPGTSKIQGSLDLLLCDEPVLGMRLRSCRDVWKRSVTHTHSQLSFPGSDAGLSTCGCVSGCRQWITLQVRQDSIVSERSTQTRGYGSPFRGLTA